MTVGQLLLWHSLLLPLGAAIAPPNSGIAHAAVSNPKFSRWRGINKA
ncbi:MAG: hypothetical protein ACFB4I_22135 [Cyanophyceae cyanobacterium]